MTSLSPGDKLADPPPPRLPADHPGVNELFALLAYGEVAAFYRLTDEARMAPDLRGRISMASMAAAEMAHYELLRDALESRGVDVVPAMSKYASALDGYHRLTTPSTWLEALVKTYVGDALAADFYLRDRRRAARRGRRRGARDDVGDRALAVRRRRGARRGDQAAPNSAAGWRCGHVVCSAKRSPRPSTCWPNTTSWSTWWCRGPAGLAQLGGVLRPAAAHARRADARTGPG